MQIAKMIVNALLVGLALGQGPTLGETHRVTSVVVPASPWNAIIGNTVLAVASVNRDGKVSAVTLSQGVTPFAEETVKALSNWQFTPAQPDDDKHPIAEVSVIAMFRPRAYGNFGVGGPALGFTSPTIPKSDHPVLPLSLSDPGWPMGPKQLREGVVVFELEIAKDGSIRNTKVIRDVEPTTDFAREAVQHWKFAPAVASGQAVDSTILVSISFLFPVVNFP